MLHAIFYTDRFIPTRFAGFTVGPIVLIRPGYKTDEGLLHHELTHVKQYWKNPLMGLWYRFSNPARLAYEAEAYKVQLAYYTDDKTLQFAKFLVEKYNLDITMDQAIAALAK